MGGDTPTSETRMAYPLLYLRDLKPGGISKEILSPCTIISFIILCYIIKIYFIICLPVFCFEMILNFLLQLLSGPLFEALTKRRGGRFSEFHDFRRISDKYDGNRSQAYFYIGVLLKKKKKKISLGIYDTIISNS